MLITLIRWLLSYEKQTLVFMNDRDERSLDDHKINFMHGTLKLMFETENVFNFKYTQPLVLNLTNYNHSFILY